MYTESNHHYSCAIYIYIESNHHYNTVRAQLRYMVGIIRFAPLCFNKAYCIVGIIRFLLRETIIARNIIKT